LTAAVFQSGLDSLVYDAAILLWISSFFVEWLIIRSGGKRSTEVRSDRGSALLILLSVFGSISIANAFSASGITSLPVAAFYAGLAMILLGVALRFWG
jgi:hypothetical protein